MPTHKDLKVPGYQVLELLGTGARSTIWQVRKSGTEKVYALKQVLRDKGADTRFLDQAISEYQVASHLNHPAVRKIYECKKVRKFFRLSEVRLLMECCEGKSVEERRPSEVTEALRVFCHVARAMQHINDQGYVHADMKPNNIVVAPSGQVKIIDLGQSCPIGTVKARIQGTPDFIAPEQLDRAPLGPYTDVYNFGASLYWTLTGQPMPTLFPKPGELTSRMGPPKITPPTELNPRVPPLISKLVLDCVQVRPAERPNSLQGVMARIRYIIEHSDLEVSFPWQSV